MFGATRFTLLIISAGLFGVLAVQKDAHNSRVHKFNKFDDHELPIWWPSRFEGIETLADLVTESDLAPTNSTNSTTTTTSSPAASDTSTAASDTPTAASDTPTEKCTTRTCTVYGDPHVSSFDNRWVSLQRRTSMGNRSSMDMFSPGDYWLVKSHPIRIQARYSRQGPKMVALALSGDLIQNNVFIVESQAGAITYNDRTVLLESSAKFEAGGLKAQRSNRTPFVQRAAQTSRKTLGVELELPSGINLIVNQHDHDLAVGITMCQLLEGQDGQCGNFNGLGEDDYAELVHQRSSLRVEPQQSLFKADSGYPKRREQHVGRE